MTRGAGNRRLALAWIDHLLGTGPAHVLSARHGLANTRDPAPHQGETDRLVWLEPVESVSAATCYGSASSPATAPRGCWRHEVPGLAARLGLVLALSGMLSAGITAFQAQRASETLLVNSARAELLTSTRVLARRIPLVREDLSRTLLALARHPAALAALDDDAQAATQLATLFALPMEANRAYFQIRLIGAADNGLERVRVNRDGDAPLRVDGDALQEKATTPTSSTPSRSQPARSTFRAWESTASAARALRPRPARGAARHPGRQRRRHAARRDRRQRRS